MACLTVGFTHDHLCGNICVVSADRQNHRGCDPRTPALILLGAHDCRKVEGFLNHKGEFLDRLEAFKHALMCGQLSDTTLTSKQERRERILWSDDIY